MKRKNLLQKRYELESFIRRHEDLERELSGYIGSTYSEYHLKLQTALKKLNEDLQKIPTGHRYSGIFYIRKPNTSPITAEKIEGSAFLREDLVRWKREIEGKMAWEQPYYRAIFKDPEMKIPIDKQDAQPVFEVVDR